MLDREKVIADIEEQIAWIRDNDFHKFPGWGHAVLAMKDAIALLKEQEAKSVEVCGQMFTVKYGHCPTCGKGMDSEAYPHWCGFCGQAVKWE